MTTELTTTTTNRALEARDARLFARHKLVYGLPVIMLSTLTMLTLPGFAMAFGYIAAGILGSAVGLFTGIVAALTAMGQMAFIGNGRLKRRLAERIGVSLPTSHFVGICDPRNNTVLSTRLDTDDNVGFLRTSDTHLYVSTEGSVLVIAQDDIYGFEIVPLAAFPMIHWIEVTYDDADSFRSSVLLMSREASSLHGQRKSTERLFERLVHWHADRQLRWHASAEETDRT